MTKTYHSPAQVPSHWRILVCIGLLSGVLGAGQGAAANEVGGARDAVRAAQALIDKSDRVIVLFDDQGQEIARFDAAFGQRPGPKEREWDGRTPEGDYWLEPARPSEQWGWFMAINYPNEADKAQARIRGQDPATLGHSIGVHAVGDSFLRNVRQSFGTNWTLGCIAVSDRAMADIRTRVTLPIPVRIEE